MRQSPDWFSSESSTKVPSPSNFFADEGSVKLALNLRRPYRLLCSCKPYVKIVFWVLGLIKLTVDTAFQSVLELMWKCDFE